ncbi:uncharacterized protein LOC118602914 isoform X2 [Rousettus aegyptiacus]|uniref:uncharacterized protein LOC118602914 isoform X2 n=1 Tax=Rousettus aegyptiacus TaxID=9407 RepID=UPI00168D2922|nr:uncharacterized protein LOC118602914 isoform X2 [Rousettus aegyptiacus]
MEDAAQVHAGNAQLPRRSAARPRLQGQLPHGSTFLFWSHLSRFGSAICQHLRTPRGVGNGRGGEAAAGFQEPGRCSRCLPAGKGYLPPPPCHSSLPTPSGPQAASAGWEGGAPGADKIWKREVCVELGAVCSLEQVNVPTSCPSRPWESTSKQPDLQKEGQAWPEPQKWERRLWKIAKEHCPRGGGPEPQGRGELRASRTALRAFMREQLAVRPFQRTCLLCAISRTCLLCARHCGTGEQPRPREPGPRVELTLQM